MIKRIAATAAAVAIPALAVVAFTASPAAANRTPNPECKVDSKITKTTLKNRPDNGNHGTWANDNLTRTVTFTVKSKKPILVQDEPKLKTADVVIHPEWVWAYHAEVVDTGTFKTFGGSTLSPNAGHGLAANTTGTVTGGYSADFIAVGCWQNFLANYDDTYSPTGEGYTGGEPASTSEFVKGDWGGKDFKGSSINDDWHWTYTTCSEKMTDSQANYNATKNEFAGDITGGKVCPSPSESTSISPSPSVSVSASPGSVVVVPVDEPTKGASAGLPVTGSKTAKIAGLGIAVSLVGAFLAWAARKRRTKFVTGQK